MKCRKCEKEIREEDISIDIVNVIGEEKLDIQAHCSKCEDVTYTFLVTSDFIGD